MCEFLKVAGLWLAAAVLVLSASAAGSTLPRPGVPGEEVTGADGDGGGEAGSGAGALVCGPSEWACADGSRCVPAAWRCDHRPHCPDASDEINCTFNSTCGPGQFKCTSSGLCIAATWRCDGDIDCGPHDQSDEDVYMCNKEFKCGGNMARCATPSGGHFQCAPVHSFCDGTRDCADGSDEWDICDNFTVASCSDLKCALGCRPTHEGLACYCQPGYEPVDGRCVDTDECAAGSYCAQTCRNTPGSYACACARGYTLRHDRATCKPINEPPSVPLSLLVVKEQGIQRIRPAPASETIGDSAPGALPPGTPPPPNNRTLLRALSVRAFDFHYTNKSVCYVHHNLSKSSLVCADADDMSRRHTLPTPDLFPDIESVSYLRVDWVSGSWYFYDESRGVLYVCCQLLMYCRLLLQRRLDRMHGLALDPTAGLMFWSVWGASPPALERANLAGEGRGSLVLHKLVYPVGVAVDVAAQHVYWADGYLDTLERITYDGKHRLTVARLRMVSALPILIYLVDTANHSDGHFTKTTRERAVVDIVTNYLIVTTYDSGQIQTRIRIHSRVHVILMFNVKWMSLLK
ncbi:unnamed protein product [Diatraea saccharalis]|uniref:EGF-like domain-containing protein n=1 Tax=Diatraea saccharalis TaxID=40085 RepID=A0A9N9RBQ7_9NEOP|nr:unnamed protein product [Diatraea saccharalis]